MPGLQIFKSIMYITINYLLSIAISGSQSCCTPQTSLTHSVSRASFIYYGKYTRNVCTVCCWSKRTSVTYSFKNCKLLHLQLQLIIRYV